MRILTIALAQICPVPGNPDANAEKIISIMQEAADKGAELIVFPECSLTGYAPDRAAELALRPGCGPLPVIEERSLDLGTAVCFGYMEKLADKLYISQELYYNGERTVYRKTHPGSKEALFFEPGNHFPAAPSPVRCGMQLCWESHIPEISSEYRRLGAELLLFPYASGMSGGQLERASASKSLGQRLFRGSLQPADERSGYRLHSRRRPRGLGPQGPPDRPILRDRGDAYNGADRRRASKRAVPQGKRRPCGTRHARPLLLRSQAQRTFLMPDPIIFEHR